MTSVQTRREGRLATITLNRPERLNAINRDMLRGLDSAFGKACEDRGVDVILLNGAGSSFCSGDDLTELREQPPTAADARILIDQLQAITRQIMLGPKIVVCAVQGWAIGAGASWPLGADLALWSDDAQVLFPEAGRQLFCSGGATWLLDRFCGPHRALEIVLGGETLDASQLVADGLAGRTVPADRLEGAAADLTDQLLSLPGDSLQRYKAARRQATIAPLERALEIEANMLAEVVASLARSGAFPAVGAAREV